MLQELNHPGNEKIIYLISSAAGASLQDEFSPGGLCSEQRNILHFYRSSYPSLSLPLHITHMRIRVNSQTGKTKIQGEQLGCPEPHGKWQINSGTASHEKQHQARAGAALNTELQVTREQCYILVPF